MASLFQSLFGGGQSQNSSQPTVYGGGINAPWTWGTSPFDLNSIVQAFHQNMGSTKARYDQLGLGGSTMEAQDLGGAPSVTGGLPQQEQALIGQEQTANVGQPALNPALQPQIQQFPNPQTASANSTALGQLAGQALGSTLGGTAAGDAASVAGDAATGDAVLGDALGAALL